MLVGSSHAEYFQTSPKHLIDGFKALSSDGMQTCIFHIDSRLNQAVKEMIHKSVKIFIFFILFCFKFLDTMSKPQIVLHFIVFITNVSIQLNRIQLTDFPYRH